jgi:RNA polymerase subunit RPABC4/transcription elongation factor Spt4
MCGSHPSNHDTNHSRPEAQSGVRHVEPQAAMRPCPSCGAPVQEDFAFCPQCGAEILTACPSCHRAVQTDWLRCPYCGIELQAAPTAIAPPSIS